MLGVIACLCGEPEHPRHIPFPLSKVLAAKQFGQVAPDWATVLCQLQCQPAGEVVVLGVRMAYVEGRRGGGPHEDDQVSLCLSRSSNEKDGPRNELQIAKNVARQSRVLHDFIVPLHVDDLPHPEINVLLTSINAISFEKSWAKGYTQLVELLERELVPKNSSFNPAAVRRSRNPRAEADERLRSGQAIHAHSQIDDDDIRIL